MENKFNSPAVHEDIERGMYWSRGRILPVLSTPDKVVDAVNVADLTRDERLMFVCLQGLVNREKPRLFLVPEKAEEGNFAWCDILGLELNVHEGEKKWEVLEKYRSVCKGVILYSSEKTRHCINLATTLAGIEDALPVTAELYGLMKSKSITLPIADDITGLEYTDAVGIYTYMYDNLWKYCNHRLIVSASPRNLHYIRDMAVCTKSAVVWFENREESEREVYKKFLADMEAGEAAATGWYTEERSGIGCAAEFGLSTIPSDYFENSTVYAGCSHKINKPKIPKMPPLENKIYAAVYLSDGDNVQYNQHVMLNLWRNPDRGSIPINWTVSPVLVDFGPGMYNYYTATATDNDCLVSGPSGAGYSLIVDRHNKKINLTDREKAKKYVTLSDRYLEAAGIHSITIWDEATDMHADVYSEYCRSLYGATLVDWWMLPEPLETMERENIALIPNSPGYTGEIEAIYKTFAEKIKKWDKKSPLFLSAQGVSWNMTPANLKALSDKLNELATGLVQLVRADHFFSLYNKANSKPYNLTLEPECTLEEKDGVTLVDLGSERTVSRIRVRNVLSADVKLSPDGESWTDVVTASPDDGVDVDIEKTEARYVKITSTATDPEIFGN